MSGSAILGSSCNLSLQETWSSAKPPRPAPFSVCCFHTRRRCRSELKAFQAAEEGVLQEDGQWRSQPDLLAEDGRPRLVQWYPGHIAKAERRLKEQLNMVDVVLEVRDARIPQSTQHQQIPHWCGAKPRILVLNRVDMVAAADQAAWSAHFAMRGQPVYWTNGMSGAGVQQLAKAAAQVSAEINAKRKARGLRPRPVRACVIGFPNVGKSALINRLLKRRACDSAPKPGVTRNLKWVRVGGELDLLDAPGVIPMTFNNQTAAQLLAMCNDIGEASYIDSQIAAALLETLWELPAGEAIAARLEERYGVPVQPSMTGESYVVALAEQQYHEDVERAAQRVLKDFRSGALGSVALEVPAHMMHP